MIEVLILNKEEKGEDKVQSIFLISFVSYFNEHTYTYSLCTRLLLEGNEMK